MYIWLSRETCSYAARTLILAKLDTEFDHRLSENFSPRFSNVSRGRHTADSVLTQSTDVCCTCDDLQRLFLPCIKDGRGMYTLFWPWTDSYRSWGLHNHRHRVVWRPVLQCWGETRCLALYLGCLLYTSPSPRDATLSRMPSSA